MASAIVALAFVIFIVVFALSSLGLGFLFTDLGIQHGVAIAILMSPSVAVTIALLTLIALGVNRKQ